MGRVDVGKSTCRSYEGKQYLRVEMLRHGTAIAFGDNREGLLMTECRFIRPLAAQGVILVDDVYDTGRSGDFLIFLN